MIRRVGKYLLSATGMAAIAMVGVMAFMRRDHKVELVVADRRRPHGPGAIRAERRHAYAPGGNSTISANPALP
jgi:hypothetical protein